MKAMVCEAFGGPEVLMLRDLPDPPRDDKGQPLPIGEVRRAMWVSTAEPGK